MLQPRERKAKKYAIVTASCAAKVLKQVLVVVNEFGFAAKLVGEMRINSGVSTKAVEVINDVPNGVYSDPVFSGLKAFVSVEDVKFADVRIATEVFNHLVKGVDTGKEMRCKCVLR